MVQYFGERREVITHCATESVIFTAWGNTTEAALSKEKEALAIFGLSDVSIPLVFIFIKKLLNQKVMRDILLVVSCH